MESENQEIEQAQKAFLDSVLQPTYDALELEGKRMEEEIKRDVENWRLKDGRRLMDLSGDELFPKELLSEEQKAFYDSVLQPTFDAVDESLKRKHRNSKPWLVKRNIKRSQRKKHEHKRKKNHRK